LLYASDGSSADLTTAQLMCPRTSTLTAPPLGRCYMFWLLTRPCLYTSTFPFVLLGPLAGTKADGDPVVAAHEQPRAVTAGIGFDRFTYSDATFLTLQASS